MLCRRIETKNYLIELITKEEITNLLNIDSFEAGFDKTMNASIVTTRNELVKEEIGIFSSKLDINQLYDYANKVN